MALNSIQSDLLPALQSTGGEQPSEEIVVYSLPHIVWDRIAYYVSDDIATLITLANFSQDLKDICRHHVFLRCVAHMVSTPI